MSILAAALVLGTPQPAQLINVTIGKVVPNLRPIAFAAAPSGAKFVATMEDGSVRILDANTRQTIRVLEKHPQPAYAVAWSPDGVYVATGDETARVWIHNALNGKKVREYRAHIRGIQKLSFNSSSTMLISTGKDDAIKVYNLTKTSPKEEQTILGQGSNFYGAAFNPSMPTVFITGVLGPGARAYDAKSGKVLGFLTGHNNQGMFDVDFNQNGTRAITAGRDGTAAIWDLKTAKKLGSLKGHGDWVIDAAFSPNGKLVATSSTDQTVKVWNTYNFQKVADIKSQSFVGSPLCFTADGKSLVTVNDQGYLQFNAVSPSQAAAPVPAKKSTKKKG